MQKQKLFVIIGIALAGLAVMMFVVYFQQVQKQMYETAKKEAANQYSKNNVAVVVAKRDIPKGTTIEKGHVQLKKIPREFAQSQVANDISVVEGKIPVVDIDAGEQITLGKFSAERAQRGLSDVTPVNKRAVTISVDNISSLVGMMKPKDHVDVLAMFPVPSVGADGKAASQLVVVPLFQNVEVLAVGQQIGTFVEARARYDDSSSKKEAPATLITVALNPQEANLLALVSEQSKMRFLMRSPSDTKTFPIQTVTIETLFSYINPNPKPPPPPPPPKETIEVIRGMQKEQVELGK